MTSFSARMDFTKHFGKCLHYFDQNAWFLQNWDWHQGVLKAGLAYK
jgi:hypothetical protein